MKHWYWIRFLVSSMQNASIIVKWQQFYQPKCFCLRWTTPSRRDSPHEALKIMSKCQMNRTTWIQVRFTICMKMFQSPNLIIKPWTLSAFLLSALSSLLVALHEKQTSLPASDEAFNFLTAVLKSKELNALVNVHDQISNRVKDECFHPILSNGLQISAEVLDLLSSRKNLSPEFEEICFLLKKPHFQVWWFSYLLVLD